MLRVVHPPPPLLPLLLLITIHTGSTLSVTEHQQIAAFYIDRGEYEQAGVHYQHAGDLGTALQLYLKVCVWLCVSRCVCRCVCIGVCVWFCVCKIIHVMRMCSCTQPPSSLSLSLSHTHTHSHTHIQAVHQPPYTPPPPHTQTQAGPSAVHCAISLVSANKDPTLVASLQQHLAGRGREGFTRDPTLVLALEVALGNWKQAAEQAWMLAKEQQDAGNYKVCLCLDTIHYVCSWMLYIIFIYTRVYILYFAHVDVCGCHMRGLLCVGVTCHVSGNEYTPCTPPLPIHTLPPPAHQVAHAQLLEMWKQFEARNKEVPAPLMDRLMLLHSYVLVKPLIAMGDDEVCGCTAMHRCMRVCMRV